MAAARSVARSRARLALALAVSGGAVGSATAGCVANLAGGSTAAAVAGSTGSAGGAGPARDAGKASSLVATSASLVSNKAAGLVSNNGAGLIGNNAAGFSGSVRGPLALIANGSVLLDPRKGVFTDPGAGAFFTDPGVGAFFTDPGAGVFFTDPGVGAFFTDPGVGAFLADPAASRYEVTSAASWYKADPAASRYQAGRYAQALDQDYLRGALVYLSAPDESFYRRDGRVIGTATSEQGEYDLARAGLAEGLPVVVNALFAGNRRLVGFAVAQQGSNKVDLDVGSTYALELLRSEARRDGKTFAGFDLGRLPDLVERARAAITAGLLGVDLERLVVGRQRQLSGEYAAALAARRADLKAWNSLLGRHLAPLTTVAGTFKYGLNVASPVPATSAPTFGASAVALAGDSTFVAIRYSHQIAEVDASGSLRLITARMETDPTVAQPPPVPQSGERAADVLIPGPIGLAADAGGNLFVTMFSAVGAPRNVILMICREPSPKFGLENPDVGRVYRIAGTPEARVDLAGFNGPSGLAVDSDGNLFVADMKNDRVIRLDRATGALRRVAGRVPAVSRTMSDTELAAGSAQLFSPSALAWRRTAQGDDLFVVDSFFGRIRKVHAPGGDWDAARLSTVAGTGAAAGSADGPVVPGGFAGDGGPAIAARFHFAQVDTFDWRGSEIPRGGLALDAARGRLYVSDTYNGRIRQIDLGTGVVTTLAGGGQNPRDGVARDCRLAQPSGLVVSGDGDVLIADPEANAVRRVTLPD